MLPQVYSIVGRGGWQDFLLFQRGGMLAVMIGFLWRVVGEMWLAVNGILPEAILGMHFVVHASYGYAET